MKTFAASEGRAPTKSTKGTHFLYFLLVLILPFSSPSLAQPEMDRDVMLDPPALDNAEGFDSMAEIMREGLGAFQNPALGPITRQRGLDLAVQTLEMSGITIMDTHGVEVTKKMFDDGLKMRHDIIAVADRVIKSGEATDELMAHALGVAALQKAKIDTLMTLARWTRIYEPNKRNAKYLERNIRAPFLPLAPYRTPHEEIRTGEIAEGECFIVLKEIHGIKAQLIPELIPVWIEPWYERRRIVGYEVVWRIQWMPAEWVKRLSTCRIDGELIHKDHQKIIHEPLMLDLWGFFGKSKRGRH